jgi:hypothetical protein
VASSCEYGHEPSGSCATELVMSEWNAACTWDRKYTPLQELRLHSPEAVQAGV